MRNARGRDSALNLSALRAPTRTPLLQVVKTSVAAILAWLVCVIALGEPLPIFAAIAALLVVQPSVSQSLTRGIERSLGVIIGVVLAYGVGLLFGRNSWIVLGVVVIALILAWAFRLSPGSTNQIPISAMLVLSIGANTPGYAANRIVETIIGAAIGLAVNVVIVPPVLLGPAHIAVGRLLRDCATALDRIAKSLTETQDAAALDELMQQARRLRQPRDAAEAAVAAGEESLALNPRRSRHRRVLEHDAQLLIRLTVLVTRIIGMARAVHDHYDDGLRHSPLVRDIVQELHRASHDLRLLGHESDSALPEDIARQELALTAPLTIASPPPGQWVLIGSLLEDMRRVHEVIVGDADG